MCVRVRVCVCVCVYVCVCMCACMDAYVHVCVYLFVFWNYVDIIPGFKAPWCYECGLLAVQEEDKYLQ